MDLDTKLIKHVMAYCIAQPEHIGASSATCIYKHKSLFVMHSCFAKSLALPSALLYHPPRWNLHASIRIIMWNVRVHLLYSFKCRATYHWVHEETSSVASHIRIWQFCVPYVYNGTAHIFNARLILACKHRAYVAIVKMEHRMLAESECHTCDSITALPCAFENTLAISVATFGIRQQTLAGICQIHNFNALNDIFCLNAICTNILHGTCANLTGYYGKVFHTAKLMSNRPIHKIVPDDTGSNTRMHAFRII